MNSYVSRGGIKLEHALKTFGVDMAGLTVLDVGSSTGGFVDCLLQNGAAKVYPVDTAYGELAWKLRIVLLKPQYGDQRLAMKHHGVIPEKSQREIVDRVIKLAKDTGYKLIDQTESPILGTGGNKEYLLYLERTE